LEREYQTEEASWCILDLENAFKFNFYDNDSPILANIIPSLLALDEVQDLEKEKLIQQL
jgi:CRISPR/Cas system-associated endonuclease/helicase Cas3